MQARRYLIVAAIVGIVAVGAILLLGDPVYRNKAMTEDASPPSPTAGANSLPQAPAPKQGEVTSIADTGRHQLQSRLNAIAQAYNDGNAKAAELALWKNHAVVRPNGEHLDRAGVLRTWAKEWTELHNRELVLGVVSFEREDDYVNASWSIDLAADVIDEFGEMHKFKLHGLQEARYLSSDGEERLDGPITYTIVDQTMNGEPWPIQ
jgi:hypothetical protein